MSRPSSRRGARTAAVWTCVTEGGIGLIKDAWISVGRRTRRGSPSQPALRPIVVQHAQRVVKRTSQPCHAMPWNSKTRIENQHLTGAIYGSEGVCAACPSPSKSHRTAHHHRPQTYKLCPSLSFRHKREVTHTRKSFRAIRRAQARWTARWGAWSLVAGDRCVSPPELNRQRAGVRERTHPLRPEGIGWRQLCLAYSTSTGRTELSSKTPCLTWHERASNPAPRQIKERVHDRTTFLHACMAAHRRLGSSCTRSHRQPPAKSRGGRDRCMLCDTPSAR